MLVRSVLRAPDRYAAGEVPSVCALGVLSTTGVSAGGVSAGGVCEEAGGAGVEEDAGGGVVEEAGGVEEDAGGVVEDAGGVGVVDAGGVQLESVCDVPHTVHVRVPVFGSVAPHVCWPVAGSDSVFLYPHTLHVYVTRPAVVQVACVRCVSANSCTPM